MREGMHRIKVAGDDHPYTERGGDPHHNEDDKQADKEVDDALLLLDMRAKVRVRARA